MNYSKMTENQKITLFYLLTFGLAFLKVISISNSILYLIIVTFFYLEFLTDDSIKIKFVKKLRYKFLDFLFLMLVQYKFFLFFLTLTLTSTRFQDCFTKLFSLENINVPSILDAFSIGVFFITIFEISKEKFKMKTFNNLLSEVFVPPINESRLDIYDEYFKILVNIEDKTFYIRKNSYNILSKDFVSIKLKQYANQNSDENTKAKFKTYARATKHLRGYSSLEMQLIRTVALEEGYYKIYIRKVFEILYTNILFRSMKEYYEKNNYVNHNRFKEYLLSVYVNNVRTKINGVVFTKMTNYLGENPNDWNKEKFYLACLGLSFQPNFSDYYVYELYSQLINDFNIDVDVVKNELEKLSKTNRNYYGGEKH